MRVQDIVLKCVITIEVILYKYSRQPLLGRKKCTLVFISCHVGLSAPTAQEAVSRRSLAGTAPCEVDVEVEVSIVVGVQGVCAYPASFYVCSSCMYDIPPPLTLA